MATNVGDIFRIKTCQELFSTELCNVFYYLVAVWTGNLTLTDVASVFTTDVVDVMRDIQVPELVHKTITVENVTNGIDFVEIGINDPGTSDSDPLPAFVTATFSLNRSNKSTRKGRKAVSGLHEGMITNGVIQAGQPGMQAVSDAFAADLLSVTGPGTDFVLEPIIVGRNLDGTLDLTRYQNVASVSYPVASTQNSRKD